MSEQVLFKRGWRTDRIWTSTLFYRQPLKRIPLAADTKALLKSQYWSREQMRSYAQARLNGVFRSAARLSFWKERFAQSGIDSEHFGTDGLARLPLLQKRDLRGRELSDYADKSELARSHLDYTSGSTGQPFEFYFSYAAELRSYAICERMFLTAAGGKRYPVIGIRARYKPGFIFRDYIYFYLRGWNSIKYRFDDLLKAAARCKEGSILYGYTSAILEIAREAGERGTDLKTRAAIATGEPLGAEQRALIEANLHTGFYLNYASREMGWIGFECEHHSLHVNEEWAYVEIVDDEGRARPDGEEGRIVVTLYDNTVMPLIRYDSGDRGTVSSAPCRCGRTLRTITIWGRPAQFIELEGGRVVPLINISPLFDKYRRSILQYQIVQRSPISFLLRVVPGPNFEKENEKIRVHLQHALHPNAQVAWEIVDDIAPSQSGKAIYFVQEFTP